MNKLMKTLSATILIMFKLLLIISGAMTKSGHHIVNQLKESIFFSILSFFIY